jgi:hypothetical protein
MVKAVTRKIFVVTPFNFNMAVPIIVYNEVLVAHYT